MILLQIADHAHDQFSQNGMQTTWTTANLITIGAVLAAFVSSWIKMLINKTKMESNITVLENDLNRETEDRKKAVAEVIAAKSTIKQELNKKIEFENEKIHERITKTQEHHEKAMRDVDKDFKEINKSLSLIQADVGKILGKLGVE